MIFFQLLKKIFIKNLKKKINFYLERIISENECYNEFSHNFSLDQVYEKLQKKLKIDSKLLNSIKKEEEETEIKYSSPRKELIKIFNFAVKKKKKESV